jgi:hypothetical protein
MSRFLFLLSNEERTRLSGLAHMDCICIAGRPGVPTCFDWVDSTVVTRKPRISLASLLPEEDANETFATINQIFGEIFSHHS